MTHIFTKMNEINEILLSYVYTRTGMCNCIITGVSWIKLSQRKLHIAQVLMEGLC